MITVFLHVGSRYPVNRKRIREAVKQFLLDRKVFEAIINVSIVGERKMKDLNEKMLKHEGITDVLSFPQYDKGAVIDYESTLDPNPQLNEHGAFVSPPVETLNLGDVVVCFPEVVRQAMKKGKMVDDHIIFLVEHGLSHLLGEHHE